MDDDNAGSRTASADKTSIDKARNWYVDDFIRYIAMERSLAKRTVIEYREDLSIFLKYFIPLFEDGLTLDGINARTISEFLLYLRMEHNYTPAGLNRKIACLKSYFRYLVLDRRLESSPMDPVSSAKGARLLPKVLTHGDVDAILEYAHRLCSTQGDWKDFRNAAILELFYATGMRLAELAGLDTSDLNFEDYNIRVLGKGSKERLVFLNQSAVDAVQEYLKVRPQIKGNALFLNRFFRRYSRRGIEIMFERIKEEAGVFKEASPHTMRHSFATHMLEGGADLVTIKNLLGHASLSTTQIYTNLSNTTMRDVYDKSHPRS